MTTRTTATRLLVRDGILVTLDPALGTLPGTDLLVEDGTIAAIGRDLPVTDAEVVDAGGTVVIPGFVDTHRHTWETVARGALPACTLDHYLHRVTGVIGPAFRPEDVHAGNLLGALEALNAGITTLVDWSHCNNTPEHADAGVAALREAGLRAVYAHGTPVGREWWAGSGLEHPDARRVRARYFSSDDSLLTFALAARGPGVTRPEVCVADWTLARDLDCRITVHAGMRITGAHVRAVDELDRAGLLGPDTTYVHATTSTDAELEKVRRSGGSVSVAPYVEMLMGHGPPPIARLVERGLAPSLGVDVATSVPGDMFTQMRTALVSGRISSFGDDVDVPFASALTHVDVLRFATLAGAQACGLGDRVGSLTPGKAADLVLIRADGVNTMPVVDPVATVVVSADTANVDTVIVGGVVRKRAGTLVGVDLPTLRATVERSRDHVLGARAP